jgi:hypothetical protein
MREKTHRLTRTGFLLSPHQIDHYRPGVEFRSDQNAAISLICDLIE